MLQPVEWKGNWTEESARTVCEDALYSGPVSAACQTLEGVDFESSIGQCIADIKVWVILITRNVFLRKNRGRISSNFTRVAHDSRNLMLRESRQSHVTR